MATRPPASARNKLMDFLARRDHSERELRHKLGRQFTPSEIDEAISFARKEGWLADPQQLAERVAADLHRRRKGYLYIVNYLRQKGLPSVAKDSELEMRKAFAIIGKRFSSADQVEKQKVARLLSGRGFDDDIIRRMIYEEL